MRRFGRRRWLQGAALASLGPGLAWGQQLPGKYVRDTNAWTEDGFQANRPVIAGDRLQLAEDETAELFLGFGLSREPDQTTWDHFLVALRLDRQPAELVRIRVPHRVHGIVPVPDRPHCVVALQKRGHGASLVDLTAGSVLQPLSKPAERQFYGHGAFLPDGSLLFNTETRTAGDYGGVLVVRDGKTLAPIDALPTHGAAPHDCQLIDDGRVLAVTNGGAPLNASGADPRPPSVAYIDVASGRLLERLEFDRPELNAGHLQISAAGDLVTVSSFRDGLEAQPGITGGISLRARGQDFRTIGEPAGFIQSLVGETLSTVINERSRRFATTTPLADTLAFWNLDDGSLARAEYLPQPKGVAMRADGSAYVVSYTYRERALVGQWSARTLRRLPQFDLLDTFISGSHLVRHALQA